MCLVADVVNGRKRGDVVEKWRSRPGCRAYKAEGVGSLRAFEADRSSATGEGFRSLFGESREVGIPLELRVGGRRCEGSLRFDIRDGTAAPRWRAQRLVLSNQLEVTARSLLGTLANLEGDVAPIGRASALHAGC